MNGNLEVLSDALQEALDRYREALAAHHVARMVQHRLHKECREADTVARAKQAELLAAREALLVASAGGVDVSPDDFSMLYP